MKKMMALTLIIISNCSFAATLAFLCPDGSKMREGSKCYPDVGCFKNGITLVSQAGDTIQADFTAEGVINLDDQFIGKTFKMKSGDNFWWPPYCEHLNGSGYLKSKFKFEGNGQVVQTYFHPFTK